MAKQSTTKGKSLSEFKTIRAIRSPHDGRLLEKPYLATGYGLLSWAEEEFEVAPKQVAKMPTQEQLRALYDGSEAMAKYIEAPEGHVAPWQK